IAGPGEAEISSTASRKVGSDVATSTPGCSHSPAPGSTDYPPRVCGAPQEWATTSAHPRESSGTAPP
ncbi:MAG: hypothetical protein ACJ71Y_12815, partial [Blastococcus sp.]